MSTLVNCWAPIRLVPIRRTDNASAIQSHGPRKNFLKVMGVFALLLSLGVISFEEASSFLAASLLARSFSVGSFLVRSFLGAVSFLVAMSLFDAIRLRVDRR